MELIGYYNVSGWNSAGQSGTNEGTVTAPSVFEGEMWEFVNTVSGF